MGMTLREGRMAILSRLAFDAVFAELVEAAGRRSRDLGYLAYPATLLRAHLLSGRPEFGTIHYPV